MTSIYYFLSLRFQLAGEVVSQFEIASLVAVLSPRNDNMI